MAKIYSAVPSRGIKPISWLIRTLLGTKYSHVLARWNGAKGTVECVWEAGGSSVRFLGPIAHLGRYCVIKEYSIPLSKAEYFRLIQYTHRYAHVKYGRKQLIGMAFAKLFRLSRNPLSRGEAEMVCSEAIGGLLKYVKQWDIDINLDVQGPDKLDQWLGEKLGDN